MWAQGVGWLAALLAFWAMTRQTERSIKCWLLVHTVFYGLHFWLLGLPLAVFANIIACLRIGISIKSRSWFWVIVLSVLSVAAGVLPKLDGLASHEILPLVASVVLTVTLFRLEGGAFRFGIFLGSLLWFVHNVFAGSWGGCALEIGLSLANLYGWFQSRKAVKTPTLRKPQKAPENRD